jgi:copper chaperone CopZ
MRRVLDVEGMHCRACESLVEDLLEEIGVKATASHEKGIVEVEFNGENIDLDQIKGVIRNEGYKVL